MHQGETRVDQRRQASEQARERHAGLPVLPLRGMVVFPGATEALLVGRPASRAAVGRARGGEGRLFLCAQRDPGCHEPGAQDLCAVGTVALLRGCERGADGGLRIVIQGLARATLRGCSLEDCLVADVEVWAEDASGPDPEVRRQARLVAERAQELAPAGGLPLPAPEEAARLCDAVASRLLAEATERQEVLEAPGTGERLAILHRLLNRHAQASAVERTVAARVRAQMERAQREYHLREQLRAIQQELGEGQPAAALREELSRRRDLPGEVRLRAEGELARLEAMPTLSSEAAVSRSYLDWLLGLPWSTAVSGNADLGQAAAVLDQDHFGLPAVKERILEFLALRQLRARQGDEARGPVLGLVGPPGCGKTSLARSVARALGRPFVRVALGGVRDESEIRGHRRTYVGALPGRLIQALRQAGANNPVLLLDELDKLGADLRGDPAAALLEVLDPEQNMAFTDHYLEVPFDLRSVLFIVTANSLGPLPRPLADRLEILHLEAYTPGEKLEIARRHLLPRQIAEAGLPAQALRVSDAALAQIIDAYTREAGVRAVERELATICRKVGRLVVAEPATRVRVTRTNLVRWLGPARGHPFSRRTEDEVGVATGLAWTESGGEVLPVEVSVLPGEGALQLTGRLGDVMRESAYTALSHVRASWSRYGLTPDFYRSIELHLHVPGAAVPKDGPSAGIAIVVAMVSALSGRAVQRQVALTGEISLHGQVLPVGGLREKVLAARREGVRWIVLPADNRGDWDRLPRDVVGGVTPVFVHWAQEAVEEALDPCRRNRAACPQ